MHVIQALCEQIGCQLRWVICDFKEVEYPYNDFAESITININQTYRKRRQFN